MAIDIFEVRSMLRQIEQMKAAQSFLRDMFFPEVNVSTTPKVDIDIVKGKRRVAPYVSPKLEGKVVARLGFSTNTVEPPHVKPKMVTDAEDLYKRQPGQTVYEGGLTPLQQAGMQLGKDMRELTDMIDRVEELQAAEALRTGKVTISGEGVEMEVDFQMSADHIVTLTSTAKWSDAGSDPLANLRTWRRKILQDSGMVPDVAVFGSSVIDTFLNHAKVQNLLNNRRIDLGFINPQALPNGVTYYGYINEVALDVYGYDEWYLDSAGDEQPMLPANRILMGSTRARNVRHYGAIKDVEVGDFAVRRFPKSWTQKDPSQRFLMVISAPLMALHQVDAFMSIQPID